MSEPKTITLTCPKCKASGEADIWTWINNVESPDEAQWMIDGFLFEYECPACGNVAKLNHNCVYEDAARKALVVYVADPSQAEKTLADLEAHKPDGYYVRLADSTDTLREKAAILRDGLDDRAVEVAKQAVFNRFVSIGDVPKDARPFYGATAEDGGIIVEFISSDGATETTVPPEIYKGIADSFSNEQPPIVDRHWAMNVLSSWE